MGKFIQRQLLPVTSSRCWEFFSKPSNLEILTPPHLQFKALDFDGKPAYPGQLINFTFRPLPYFYLKMSTEIIKVKPETEFADRIRSGMFKYWHHRHIFRETTGGIEMTDVIHYKLRLGLLGVVVDKLFVGNLNRKMFEYRRKKLEEIFSSS